jgi:2-aminoethylphosphonate-pyruvate transaminase
MPSPARSETGDPLPLTPGPMTTSKSVKQAAVDDWGSRDATFVALNAEVMENLPKIIHGEDALVTAPMQGLGGFAVEAMLTTFAARVGAALVLVNGAYGQRAKRILSETPAITHIFAVHCETTSGVLNSIERIAALCARHGRRLPIDAPSAFGALDLDARMTPFDAVAASANKCLEDAPGLGFVVCRREALAKSEGDATTLSLDLLDQRRNLEKTGRCRFTPPIRAIVALHQALRDFWADGGGCCCGRRYRENARILIGGMRSLGFETLPPDALQAPIIGAFRRPSHPNFPFQRFYDSLKERGYLIYPGKLKVADSLRIGCIGALYSEQMRSALRAARETLAEMRVAPAPAA